MQIELLEIISGKVTSGKISRMKENEVPLQKDNWKFNWPELIKTEGSYFFKITLDSRSNEIQGIVMLSIYFGEMVFMNNLELAPWNIGEKKKYDYVAGCLIAYACRFSLEEGKENYHGYLTFESKTDLIPLYEKKYGARRSGGLKMFIEPEQGEKLIGQYLEFGNENNHG